MIAILLQGGLGNQMFQYALGVAFRLRGREVNFYAPKLAFGGGERPHDRNLPDYGLGEYDTDITFSVGARRPYWMQQGVGYNPEVFDVPDGTTVCGYWQSEKYFSEFDGPLGSPIVHAFFPKRGSLGAKPYVMAMKIQDDDSVAVQVRRGDYTQPGIVDFHGVMDRDYYFRGVEETGRKKVFVFTDDETWCRENLPEWEIANTGSRHWDIALMSAANSAVIANSTFGWWGAWLGDKNFIKPGRRVIAPKNWFAGRVDGAEGIVPARWVRL